MLSFAIPASAHVVVRPDSAGIGSYQVFTVSVPSEKPLATIGLRLVLPAGLQNVTPNVKPGWQIKMSPAEIDWTGGTIPADQRDEFEFQAQVPATAATLAWKAYQTYADGSVVAWDETPGSTAANPYSVTTVIDDLTATPKTGWLQANGVNLSLILSLAAILLAAYSLKQKNRA